MPACEILFVLAVIGPTGVMLESDCRPSLEACWDSAFENVQEDEAAMWQCLEIGSMVDRSRRHGRRDRDAAEMREGNGG